MTPTFELLGTVIGLGLRIEHRHLRTIAMIVLSPDDPPSGRLVHPHVAMVDHAVLSHERTEMPPTGDLVAAPLVAESDGCGLPWVARTVPPLGCVLVAICSAGAVAEDRDGLGDWKRWVTFSGRGTRLDGLADGVAWSPGTGATFGACGRGVVISIVAVVAVPGSPAGGSDAFDVLVAGLRDRDVRRAVKWLQNSDIVLPVPRQAGDLLAVRLAMRLRIMSRVGAVR